MEHSEFSIGCVFWIPEGSKFRCTDIGSRVVVAIRVDQVETDGTSPELKRILTEEEAEREGWFRGPPYGVLETVFDENELDLCSLTPPEADDS